MDDAESLVDMQIPAAHFRVLVACLVLGTLGQLEAGRVGPSAGIWCFSLPRFGQKALARGLLSEEFVEALREAIDFNAIEERIPEQFPAAIARLRAAALTELSHCSDRDYSLTFPLESE